MFGTRLLILVFVILFGRCESNSDAYKQEGARVVYMNPKYVKDVVAFTSRASRKSPYLTNINATILHPWGNNITASVVVEYYDLNQKIEAFKLDLKSCDWFKLEWVREWIKTYSDLIIQCPVPAGTYHMFKLELPPKRFPIPLKNVDYHAKFLWTSKNVKIVELEIDLKSKKK